MRLTLLTPCAESGLQFLPELQQNVGQVKSLLGGQGIEVEWSLWGDGAEIPDQLGGDKTGWSRERQGVSAARNQALGQSVEADLVYPVDADDLIDQDGLLVLLGQVKESQGYGFWASNRTTLSGKSLKGAWTSREKTYDLFEYGQAWCEKKPTPHANSILYRRSAIEEAGGWPHLSQHEDVLLLARVNQKYGGVWLPVSVTLYRLWEGQTIARPDYRQNKQQICMEISREINQARRQAGLSPVEERLSSSGTQWREENLTRVAEL